MNEPGNQPPGQTETPNSEAGDKPFYEGWSDDLKTNQSIVNAKSPEDIARMYLNAEKRLGAPADQLIRLPTKPEEFKDVFLKLGAPEKPDGYKIDLGDKATDADKAIAGKFAEAMHAAGPFPQSAVEASIKFWRDAVAADDEATNQAMVQAREAGEAALKKEWGAAYDQTARAVGDLVNKYGGKELHDELWASGLGDNPRLASALAKMAARMSEGTGSGPGEPRIDGVMTPDQARAARIAMENDREKARALNEQSHPMHKVVVDERRRLLRFEAGQKPG